jgi:TM2 domain-containing membrane protein YozV
MIQSANLTLRFLLELSALAAIGGWAYRTGGTILSKLVRAGAAAAVAAVVWAAFVAPDASVPVPGAVRFILQVLIFGAATAALFRLRRPVLASVFGAIVVVNAALMAVWGQ